jgi:FAD/FMN-containing dehydrogenase
MRLPCLASILVAALASPSAAALAATPGTTACTQLTSQLGTSKVISNKLNPTYISTIQDYWNALNSQYLPSCIVLPTSAADVSAAVKAAKAAKSRFAIKTAGHNPNKFFSSVDQGVLISTANLNAKSYDAKTTLASYGPGTTFGEVYEYFAPYNVTVVGARLAGVGTGLALGGGLSYLSSQYGMAADSFRELEVVLPSGQITTASAKVNPDLFLGLKGGGGNAYGIVTRYTVQSRPIGTFYAGNIIYFANQTIAVLEAIRDFTRYNTDPKAAIIGTYEKLTTPGLGLNLDEACIMFAVYDGPNPGNVFDNFTRIPYLINTLKGGMTYNQVVNLPVPGSTDLSRGDNFFRNAVHHIEDDSYKTAIANWETWANNNKGDYTLTSIDFQPIPKSLTDASRAQGGNAMNMPDGPWYWLNFLITSPPLEPNATYTAAQNRFKTMAESVPSATDLPLFINDAAYDQNPLKTFSTYKTLQATKKKYDPDSFFAEYTGGWSFTA